MLMACQHFWEGSSTVFFFVMNSFVSTYITCLDVLTKWRICAKYVNIQIRSTHNL